MQAGDVFSIDGDALEVTGESGEGGRYLLANGSTVVYRTTEQLAALRQPVVARAAVEDGQLVLHDSGVYR